MLTMCILSNVYAEEYYDSLIRGQSILVDQYDSATCVNNGNLIAFEVDEGCLFTNNLASKGTTQNHLYYTDSATGDKYYIELLGTDPPHTDSKISTYELVIAVNNKDSFTRTTSLEEYDLFYNGITAVLDAGYYDGKFYFYAGDATAPEVVDISYDSANNMMNIDAHIQAIAEFDVLSDYKLYNTAWVTYHLFFFLTEADSQYEAKAKTILEDASKRKYVYAYELGGESDLWSYNTTNQTEDLSFTMYLNEGSASRVEGVYNTNFAKAQEEENKEEENPVLPEDPMLPAVDPTNPTQPTQPAPQPNTGTFTSIIGVVILGVIGVLLTINKKSKFERL